MNLQRKHRYTGLICGLFCAIAAGIAHGQQANVNLDWDPHRNAERLIPFSAPLNSPEVHDNRTVTFRVLAPHAQTVALNGAILTELGREWGETLPFVKGEDGIWTLTLGPIRPDIYAYHVQIDGVQTVDPSNTIAAFTGMPPYSQLVVHGDAPAWYDAREVPHGTITRHIYHSGVTGGERDLYVYTPPGYDPARTYPVLYLVGGSGELPHNWMYDGRVNLIMDNLLAEDRAVPMLIAIPNNQVVHRNHPRHVELTFDLFAREMREHVIPLVDAAYSTIRSPKGRGLSGLSMGGRHTMMVGFNALDLFGSFGVLSAGDTEPEKTIGGFLNDPEVNSKVDYLFVGQGTREAKGFFGERVDALIKAFDAHGVRHEYYVGGGMGHDWSTWRHLLHERFLPNLWRQSYHNPLP